MDVAVDIQALTECPATLDEVPAEASCTDPSLSCLYGPDNCTQCVCKGGSFICEVLPNCPGHSPPDVTDAESDASGGCQPGEGCFGEPCESADDCLSSICTMHMGDTVCSKTCDATCPQGWSCQFVNAGGGDGQFVQRVVQGDEGKPRPVPLWPQKPRGSPSLQKGLFSR